MSKRLFTIYLFSLLTVLMAFAQTRTVENRPYTDLRPLHLGIIVGTHLQDMELVNVGQQMLTLKDGRQIPSLVTCDQHNWDIGFNVGVLAEARINEYFAFRGAPQLYFGNRNIAFLNYNNTEEHGGPYRETQSLRSVYVGADLDIIYAAKRFNNHRPYIMAGICPMLSLSSNSKDYVQLKKSDIFLEAGIGCDFYLPFFKLRPELKFMYGLTNCLNRDNLRYMDDAVTLPYAASVKSARTKMIVLSFHFE